MFQKVLISDDFGSINQGVRATLEQAGITEIKQVQYCDDAYLEIKSALAKEDPYDLLITDLHFKSDHRKQQFSSGAALAERLSEEHPGLPIIAYSVEDRLQKVRQVMQYASAYVCKGRDGLKDLSQAINVVSNGERFLSAAVARAIEDQHDMEMEAYDIRLLSLLAQGYSKDQISQHFKDADIKPNSLSSIEKRQSKLLIQFGAQNATHLIGLVKDLGLI